MRKILSILVLVVSVFCASAANAAVLDVGLNRAELVSLDTPMSEVMVANPDVADIVVHGSNKISVIGKKIGTTNMRFFDEDKNVIKEYDVVVGYDLPAIRRMLKRYFPELNVGIETINNSLAVSGVVPDAQASNRVMQIVYEFVKENRRAGEEEQDFTRNDNRFPGIVNLMTLNSGQQVMLKVKIGELKRTALKTLGINLQEKAGSVFSFANGGGLRQFLIDEDGAPKGAFNQYDANADSYFRGFASVQRGRFQAGAMVEALQRDGLFKVIAEPNLTAVSGETASFLAGGEFPIRTVTTEGVDIQYKKFGVALAFTPYVLTKNRVRMVVAPEFSEIASIDDSTGDVTLNSRKATTTVELAPGEAFMIAGLIRDRVNASISSVPGIAEIPIISALMRSSSYEREETELVISVTPYIVDPVVASEIRMPSDEYRSPSVMEMFFYGALGSLSGGAQRVGETPVLEGPIGYMVD